MESATYSLRKTLGLEERIENDCKLLRGGKFVERRFARGDGTAAGVARFIEKRGAILIRPPRRNVPT
jgi:hypothetical protein